MAQVFAHHRAVFKLHQGVVIAASGAGFGELLDVQLAQESGHLAIDVFRAVVGMEALDGEGEGGEEGFEDREQEAFADAFYRADELELGDRIDEIDVVEPLDPVQVTLVGPNRRAGSLDGPLGAVCGVPRWGTFTARVLSTVPRHRE